MKHQEHINPHQVKILSHCPVLRNFHSFLERLRSMQIPPHPNSVLSAICALLSATHNMASNFLSSTALGSLHIVPQSVLPHAISLDPPPRIFKYQIFFQIYSSTFNPGKEKGIENLLDGYSKSHTGPMQ